MVWGCYSWFPCHRKVTTPVPVKEKFQAKIIILLLLSTHTSPAFKYKFMKHNSDFVILTVIFFICSTTYLTFSKRTSDFSWTSFMSSLQIKKKRLSSALLLIIRASKAATSAIWQHRNRREERREEKCHCPLGMPKLSYFTINATINL